jgi:hypothetical protein
VAARSLGRAVTAFAIGIVKRFMKSKAVLAWSAGSVCILALAGHVWAQTNQRAIVRPSAAHSRPGSDGADRRIPPERSMPQPVTGRLERDLAAMERFRPAYPFWRHIFAIPDGAIAFGRAVDGRLLAAFPVKGDWVRDGVWEDTSFATFMANRRLPDDLWQRREAVAQLLESSVGPVLHNATRGLFVLPNLRRYAAFLSEWGAIYERFGVPAELGLAQALVESGLNGTVRSEARAIGFCQWLLGNWNRLKQLAPHVIEGHNQTTQAPYCAAYLSILATKYGSFIPALSEHHTGGANVGRTLINGERLGGVDVRERYFLGAEFARDLRAASPGAFSDLYGTYGPRSFLYAEMVFGNAPAVVQLIATTPQSKIFAMRTTRALTVTDIVRRTGLSAEEIRRFNPALLSRVPVRANLYLPRYVPAFGRDVTFWHRPASPAYSSVLTEFLGLHVSVEQWDSASFDSVLTRFRTRFEATASDEGAVMATTLSYVLEERRSNRQAQILAEFRSSERIAQLFEHARLQRVTDRASHEAAVLATDGPTD